VLTDGQGLEVLEDDECARLLAGASFGRVGLLVGGVPAILPVNYHFADGSIWFYSGPGVKLEAARNRETVAFEVDAIDSDLREGWSVLASGPCSVVIEPDDLRPHGGLRVQPWAPGRRDTLLRISVGFVSGRRLLHHSARAER
jgi:uncharacterized protein